MLPLATAAQSTLDYINGTDTQVPFRESPRVGTNDTSQWNLVAIIMLELIGDSIPGTAVEIME